MATDVAADDFVTIVPVGDGRPVVHENNFVTVLTVGAAAGAAEVKVQRSRGERLGLGLKFEGGSAAAEKVRRLLVQSCAEHSPAANAITPWGKLIPGDEILAIDGVPVFELTRIDCVRRLKDSDESLTLLVRHFDYERKTCDVEPTDTSVNTKPVTEIVRPSSLPPPVPPRKLGKKNSFKDKPSLQTVGEQNTILSDNISSTNNKDNTMNGQHNSISNITKLSRKSSFDSHIHRQTKEGGIAYFKKGSPEEVRRLVRRLSDGKAMPPEAEVYMDLLSTEWERCLVLAEVESDDTGSSISTVVDRLGSMTSSVENSIPSTPVLQHKTIDIQKVLNCIENIDSNILNDIAGSKNFLEKQIEINKDTENNQSPNGYDTIEATIVGQKTDEISRTFHKLQQNDKNNNNTIIESGNFIETTKSPHETPRKSLENKAEFLTEKPKPMPRNAKIERSVSDRKPKAIQLPDTSPPSVPDTLLTPTKKTCIETWLQRSEAEMNNKNIDKLEDSTLPEVLPRLIDFVPKPQFKECNEIPLPRPSTAPPPPPAPPVETREDGSGASLDTIGELDESTDVTDNAKTASIENETKERKASFERSFWEDRVSKSDAEDKSLSNDETPLPSCPRQPPDGVETPSDAVEKILEPPSRLPPRIPAAWPTSRSRYSYSSRTQDARSEASVKDKIAMFSNGRAASTEQLDKCGTLPARTTSNTRKSAATFINYSDVSSLDRRLTKSQDNLDEMPRIYKKDRHSDRPEVLGAIENTNTSSIGISTIQPLYEDKKPSFYGSTATLVSNIDSSISRPIYHMRSISDDSTNVSSSKHKSNLEYLIEQRKKSMTKLKCLAIPEAQGPIVDLPEIKIQGTLTKSFLSNSKQNNSKENKAKSCANKPEISNETKWKVNLLPNNIPKYSPAFKRKSLQVYTPSCLSKESTPERKFYEKVDNFNKVISYAAKPIRTTLDLASNYRRNSSTLPVNPSSSSILPKKDNRNANNYIQDYKNVEIKICTATDIIDSDNDSAMSSTQSSYRSSASSPMHNVEPIESDNSQLSPRISHYTPYSLIKPDSPSKSSVVEKNCEEYIKRNVCRSVSSDTNVSLSSSAGSGATSGSQASCSSLESSAADSDKRRISKAYNIDTINRRNILASAKCRSGRDAKLKSPVIESKFSHESHDRSPSPVDKSSERLSTLTSSVSALSNKGECRRRNKVIAESDSDSDCDINVRQRKSDFKTSRLKRNSSLGNKTKPNETEDISKNVSEKNIQEISIKGGLDNLNNNTKSNILEKKTNESLKPDKSLATKDESTKKVNTTNMIVDSKHVSATKSTLVKGNVTRSIDRSNNTSAADKIDGTCFENNRTPTHTIRLKRGAGTGVGLILAGGVDCEAKDVTVYRVLEDSIAAKAGLKRGAKVRSINGFTMTGLTHAQSVTILKEQRSEVVIELDNGTQDNVRGVGCGSEKAESKDRHEVAEKKEKSSNVVTVILEKAGGGAGLGFGLDGGRDSPHGDRPLTVKKLFAGGAAAQSGRILVGAELLSAGGQSMEGFTRTQAWAALKGLPVGPVALVLRNPKTT